MGENGVQYAQKKIIYNEIDSGCAEQNFPGFNLRCFFYFVYKSKKLVGNDFESTF